MFYYFISSENEDEDQNGDEEYFLWQIEDLLVEIDLQINGGADLY